MKNIFFVFALVLMLISVDSCGIKTEEEKIKDTVGKLGNFAEERNVDGILSYIAEDYLDMYSRTKNNLRQLLNSYFRSYRGIVVHILGTRVIEINLPEAQIETDVALSSGAGKIFRKLASFYGEYYRIKVKLVKKNSRWVAQEADWKSVNIEVLFPESLKILEKILPEALK